MKTNNNQTYMAIIKHKSGITEKILFTDKDNDEIAITNYIRNFVYNTYEKRNIKNLKIIKGA